MDLKSQRRIASEILKCGINRVRVTEHKDVDDALTREDIRILIKKGMIKKKQKKGTCRVKARKILKQKSRGRMRGAGSKKGKITGGKDEWVSLVRAQRRVLGEMRDSGQLTKANYRILYLRSKGGMFRNKKHLLSYMKEHDMFKIDKGK